MNSIFVLAQSSQVEVSFSAAHYLNDCEELQTKKCTNIHGHNYRVVVNVSHCVSDPKSHRSNFEDNLGKFLDFFVLKEIANEVVGEFDHKFIMNRKAMDEDVVGSINRLGTAFEFCWVTWEVTAENMALVFAANVLQILQERDAKKAEGIEVKVEVWETERGCASATVC